MKRLAKNLVLGAVLATPALAADAPLDSSPLKPLCEMICGGTWRPADYATVYPDKMYVSHHYEWDKSKNAISGVITRSGGIGGVHMEAVVLFGTVSLADSGNGSIWTLRADGNSPPVYGTVTLSGRGFTENSTSLGNADSRMVTIWAFSGEDSFTMTSEIHDSKNGQVALSAPVSWVRVKE
jgi:hypothetical protein